MVSTGKLSTNGRIFHIYTSIYSRIFSRVAVPWATLQWLIWPTHFWISSTSTSIHQQIGTTIKHVKRISSRQKDLERNLIQKCQEFIPLWSPHHIFWADTKHLPQHWDQISRRALNTSPSSTTMGFKAGNITGYVTDNHSVSMLIYMNIIKKQCIYEIHMNSGSIEVDISSNIGISISMLVQIEYISWFGMEKWWDTLDTI